MPAWLRWLAGGAALAAVAWMALGLALVTALAVAMDDDRESSF